ncbi:MAG: cobalamin biosynthesis protein CobD, partial [Actinomycetospora chiangmaiensis]|nr:cobalamin biosynthesis protein CobD [Actinomycetospora chiangmaiensis]
MTTAALLIEAFVGYPDWLFRRIGHPVTWMGAGLASLDRRLNRPGASPAAGRRAGVLALLLLLGGTALASGGLALLGLWWWGFPLFTLAAASLPAQRSLAMHVDAVADALDREGLDGGRRAVSMIVGRNPDALDEGGVARAAIESLAENFSDGVVAPAVWMAVLGLPGAALYKAINTADSMIGHRTPRHLHFGWAAARLDDWVNWPASRLSVVWIVLAAGLTGGSSAEAIRAVRRDARHHRSPNAGWPESAFAGALGFKLAGPRVYGTQRVEDGYMGDGRADLGSRDIRRALRL